ncbi:hypothetical protein EVAR_59991_1 [Eumeta japonica]|uniref:Uncharacterized protein n=1 Tax=Eumeta variegata TaxID=151549 RepID=A0A4C1ZLK8_EUMVA|nr:hypothetical protein EVAR_59991_1 [Eumeta japonica]
MKHPGQTLNFNPIFTFIFNLSPVPNFDPGPGSAYDSGPFLDFSPCPALNFNSATSPSSNLNKAREGAIDEPRPAGGRRPLIKTTKQNNLLRRPAHVKIHTMPPVYGAASVCAKCELIKSRGADTAAHKLNGAVNCTRAPIVAVRRARRPPAPAAPPTNVSLFRYKNEQQFSQRIEEHVRTLDPDVVVRLVTMPFSSSRPSLGPHGGPKQAEHGTGTRESVSRLARFHSKRELSART